MAELLPFERTPDEVRAEPVGFVEDELHMDLWSKQREILEAVRDHDYVAVKACHASGKTAAAGAIVGWWLGRGPGSVVITTAPTFRQVKKLLWSEIRRRVKAAPAVFETATLNDTELEIDDEWLAIGLSTDEAENFQGWHADRILVIVDEASGVGEVIFEAIEGVLAGGEAKLLLLGNPTRLTGQFYRAFHSERAGWKTITISAFDTPAYTGERVSEELARRLTQRKWVEQRRVRWGEESPLWHVRVLGEFASEDDFAVCSLAAVEAAQRRSCAVGVPGEVAVVACDVAREGSDETVIVARRGGRVRVVKAYVGRDTMRTVGEVTAAARQLQRLTVVPPVIVIDDPGVGGGVVDRLRELGEFDVVAFKGGSTANNPERYVNRRSEAWFELAEQLPTLDLPPDEQLAADLVAPRWRLESDSKRRLEKKEDTKKRLRRSPDRGDAVVMAMSVRSSSWVPAPVGEGPLSAIERFLRTQSDGTLLEAGESLTADLFERNVW